MPSSATCVCVVPTISTGATLSSGNAEASAAGASGTPTPSTHSVFCNDTARAASNHASSASCPSTGLVFSLRLYRYFYLALYSH
jgi:hypothetical protein